MNLEDLIDAAQGDNQEPDFEWVSRPDWVRWANEAVLEISNRAGPLRYESTVTLVQDQHEYDLDEGIIRIMRVTFEDSDGETNKIEPRSQAENDYYGTPDDMMYHVKQATTPIRVLRLEPAPDSDQDGQTLTYEYIGEHPELVDDSDTVQLPRSLKKYIVDYMSKRFAYQDSEMTKHQIINQEWERGVQRAIAHVRNRGESNTSLVDASAAKRRNYRRNY